MPSLGGWEFVILLVVLVLLFGAKKLPDMARSLGQSARVLKGEIKGLKDEEPRKAEAPAPSTAQPAAPPEPPAALPVGQQNRQEPDRAAQPGRTDTGQ